MSNSFFNLGISILINKLFDINEIRQIWVADDGTLYGNPEGIMKAWDLIKEFGPTIGFFPNNKSTIYLLDRKSEQNGRTSV